MVLAISHTFYWTLFQFFQYHQLLLWDSNSLKVYLVRMVLGYFVDHPGPHTLTDHHSHKHRGKSRLLCNQLYGVREQSLCIDLFYFF